MAQAVKDWAPFLAILCLSACAHPPRFVRTTPVLRLLYRPATMPYLGDPRFSFELPARWTGPEPVPGGVKFREPKARAAISAAYLAQGEPGWRPPEAFRQFMREQGTVDDSHVLARVEVSSKTADVARFTEVAYAREYLLGQKVDLTRTELVMVEYPRGIYVLRYEALRGDFPRFHRAFEAFLRSVVLADPKALDKNE